MIKVQSLMRVACEIKDELKYVVMKENIDVIPVPETLIDMTYYPNTELRYRNYSIKIASTKEVAVLHCISYVTS